MTICRDWTLVKSQGGILTAEPLRCRSWGCQLCGPERTKRLIAQAIGGRPNTFITLTTNPAIGESPVERARALVKAWRTIRRRAAKLPANGKIPFLAVFERTKKGEPHLHILCRSTWIPQEDLSDWMAELTSSPIVWIERIDNASKAAFYCAKYCAKDLQKFDTLKRYWCSQDYELDPPEPIEDDPKQPTTFEVVKEPLEDWAFMRQVEGYIVQTTKEGLRAWHPVQLHRQVQEAPARDPPRGGLRPGERASPASKPGGG